MTARALVLILAWMGLCSAGEIVLPSNALEREPVQVIYRTTSQATGKGRLSIRWTDVYGRVVEDRQVPVELTDETEAGFTLDLRRAVAMRNELSIHFSFEGTNAKGAPDRREEDARVSFIARPPDREWRDYVVLMWQSNSAANFATLKTLGINAGQYGGKAKTPPEFLLKNDLRWYAENIATDFYSEYHRWRPDRVPHWSFLQAKELYRKDPTSKEAFKRHPSLSDPAWLKKIRDRLIESARFHSPYRPVFYSLGDESGIADLAAYWDFDFSDISLSEMRIWLRERYGTLAALNRQWGTSFDRWDLVIPETTNEAMKRGNDNFSSWSDHKEWMDIAYARALKAGVDAVRSVDPDAYVAIGGGQMPGWGGYDYYHLSRVLTAIEPYDIGNNVEILRSLNPRLAFVTTAFQRGPWEKHRIWYELLHGARGNLIWDDKAEHVGKDGTVGPRGREVEPYYNELRRGIGALIMNSERLADPIAIHYSQASMRAEWMLAQRPKGEAWVNRTSATERRDSDFLRLRESYCRLIEDLGLQYNFVAYGQIEDGELLRRGYRVLILPRSTALSQAEVAAIREFVLQGGTLIADGEPGVFDDHCRRLERPQLGDLFAGAAGRGKAVRLSASALDYHQQRVLGKGAETLATMRRLIAEAGVQPEVRLSGEDSRPVAGIELHRFRNGGVTIAALLGNPQMRVDELGPPDFKSNSRFEKPQGVRLAFAGERFVYDVRKGKPLGSMKQISITVDPYEPSIFALSPSPLPEVRLAAPAQVFAGETGSLGISAESPAAVAVFHVDALDPSEAVVAQYSGNVIAAGGSAGRLVPFAENDKPGMWMVRVRDVLSGSEQAAKIEVRSRE